MMTMMIVDKLSEEVRFYWRFSEVLY